MLTGRVHGPVIDRAAKAAALLEFAAADGIPLDRIAILHAGAEPYARLAHEHLAAAGVSNAKPFPILPIAFPDVAGSGNSSEMYGDSDFGLAVSTKSKSRAAAETFVKWMTTTTAGQQVRIIAQRRRVGLVQRDDGGPVHQDLEESPCPLRGVDGQGRQEGRRRDRAA